MLAVSRETARWAGQYLVGEGIMQVSHGMRTRMAMDVATDAAFLLREDGIHRPQDSIATQVLVCRVHSGLPAHRYGQVRLYR